MTHLTQSMVGAIACAPDFATWFSMFGQDCLALSMRTSSNHELTRALEQKAEETGDEAWLTIRAAYLLINTSAVAMHCGTKPADLAEFRIRDRIAADMEAFFPGVRSVCVEKVIPAGRIDIYGEEKDSRPVIFEVKNGKKSDPTRQLLHYASFFENPRLVAVGTHEVPEARRAGSVEYWLFNDDGVRRYA